MSDELLPPNPGDDPPTPPAPTGRRITCDYCKCSLAASGDVLRMSSEAKAMRDLEHTLEKVRKELADAQALTAIAVRERDEARAALPKKSALW